MLCQPRFATDDIPLEIHSPLFRQHAEHTDDQTPKMMHIECTNPSVMDFLLRSKLLVLWRNSNGLYELSIILTEACIGCRNCEHVRDQILEYKSYKLVCSSELISSLQIDSCSTCFFLRVNYSTCLPEYFTASLDMAERGGRKRCCRRQRRSMA